MADRISFLMKKKMQYVILKGKKKIRGEMMSQAYNKLIKIVSNQWSHVKLRKFSDWAFNKNNRSVMSIGDEDIAKFHED